MNGPSGPGSGSPGFGAGINVFNSSGMPVSRVTAQKPVNAGKNYIDYTDMAGRTTRLGNLKSEEVQVLKQKHGL